MKKPILLSKRLAQYTSIAGAILAVSSAKAQIVYTDLNPDVVIGPGSEFHLDLNNDGIADFNLAITTFINSNNEPDFSMYIVNEFNYMHSRVLVYGESGTVKQLDYGYSINENLGKWDAFGMLGNKSNAVWDDQEKFVGVHTAFYGEPGQHYGWIRIAVQSADLNNLSITVKDYAYNSVRDEPILAGQGTGTSCTNSYEPNNSFSQATPISTNASVLSLISPAVDKDFYQFSLLAGQPNMRVTLSGLPKNYNMKLYDGSKEVLATSNNKKKENEIIVYNNGAAGTYYVKVYPKDNAFDAANCYTLGIETSSTPFKISSGGSGDDLTVNVFPNPATQFITLQFKEAISSEIPVRIFDLEGREMMNIVLPAGEISSQVNISALTPGMYLLKAIAGNQVVMKKFSVVK